MLLYLDNLLLLSRQFVTFISTICYFYLDILLLIRCPTASYTSHPQPPKRTKKIYKRLIKEYPPDILSRFLTKISRKKQKKKGKFLTKLPKCIFEGQAPFSLRENSPSSKEGWKGTETRYSCFWVPNLTSNAKQSGISLLNTP